MSRTILSVGGSIIIPKTGFSIPFLQSFRKMILKEVAKGKTFIIVVGGGATCRAYQSTASAVAPMSKVDLDWLGIHTTRYNAQFVRFLFQDVAYKDVVLNPTIEIKTKKPIIIAAGYEPGCSTDTDAVMLAKTYCVTHLLNLSNIDFAYDKDPNVHPDAQKIESISWKKFREIVGNEWNPGMSAPFDPIASKMAQKLGMTVSILNGTNLKEVQKAINGKKFVGTQIG